MMEGTVFRFAVVDVQDVGSLRFPTAAIAGLGKFFESSL